MKNFSLIKTLALGLPLGFAAGWMNQGRQTVLAKHSDEEGPKAPDSLTTPGTRSQPAEAKKTASLQRLGDEVLALDAVAVRERFEALLSGQRKPEKMEVAFLMARWAETDPEAGLAFFNTLQEDDLPATTWGKALEDPAKKLRREALGHFFQAWTALSPDVALASTQQTPGFLRDQALSSAVAGLKYAEAATIRRIFQGASPDGRSWDKLGAGMVLQCLAAKDLAAVKTMAADFSGGLGDAAVQAVAGAWAKADPAAAWQWLGERGEDARRSDAGEAVLKHWAQRDPQAVGPFLLVKTPGAPDRLSTEAATIALRGLASQSPEAAAAFAKAYLPPEQLRAKMTELIFGFTEASNNAAGLCEVAEMLPEATSSEQQAFTNMRGSPESMLKMWRLIAAQPASRGQRLLLKEFARVLSADAPAAFLREAMALPDEASREAVLKEGLTQQGETFPVSSTPDWRKEDAEVRELISQLPASLRPAAERRLLLRLITHDPQEAVARLNENPPLAADPEVARTLGQEMARIDPAAAATWATSLPDESARAEAVAASVRKWAMTDSLPASEWAGALPPGAERDAAAKELASYLSGNDREAALAWAVSIGDDAARLKSVQNVVRAWAKHDPNAAAEGIRASALPEAAKDALYQALQEQR